MTTIYDLFPTRFIGPRDLNGRTPTLLIRCIETEEVYNSEARDTVEVPVLYFSTTNGRPTRKGIVLKKTIARAIAEAYGPTIEDWTGQPVELFTTTVKAFGGTHTVVRIRPANADGSPERHSEEPPTTQDTTQ